MAAGSYAFDPKRNGFGLIRLSHSATAVFVDPEQDALYVVMDENDEPTDALLPLDSTAVVPDGKTIFEFDSPSGDGDMVYRWRGKLNKMKFEQSLRRARVEAESYENIVVKHYGDGVLLKTRQVQSNDFFTVPATKSHKTYEHELIGTSTVQETLLVDDIRDVIG